jgi:hypothetical protein
VALRASPSHGDALSVGTLSAARAQSTRSATAPRTTNNIAATGRRGRLFTIMATRCRCEMLLAPLNSS